MALTRITKGVIKPNEDYETRHVKATGIITATELDVNGNADVSGNLSVSGVLTYEDVTSIDSVGIITAQKDVHVGAGLSVVGLSTFSNGVVVKTGTATTALVVEGNTRVTGILTVGTGSLTITDRDINAVGVVTGSNFKTGTSNVHNVGIEVAQINVLGGPTKIGAGITITHEGNFLSSGISTAKNFKTGTTNVHDVGIEVAQLNVLGGDTKIGSGLTITNDGNSIWSGVSTARNFKTGTTNVHDVGIELAGINVLGADTPIGTGATVFNTGDIVSKSGAEFQGIVTATSFVGDGLNLTNTGSSLSEPGSGTHRLVTTSLTSGTMTSSGTDSTLSFNYGTHTLSATNFSGDGANLTNLTAANLTGTVPIARLGSSGTKSGSTFLAGDNTFKTVTVAINSISDDGNNRLLTSDGDATATAEANLTFDGSTIDIAAGSSDKKIQISGTNPYIQLREGTTNKAYIQWSNSGWLRLANEEEGALLDIRDSIRFSDNNGSSYSTVWHSGNDGAGSGLDADTLDGVQGGSYLRSDTDDTLGGQLVISTGTDQKLILQGSSDPYIRFRQGTTDKAYIQSHSNGNLYIVNEHSGEQLFIGSGASGLKFHHDGTNSTVWHAGNDGSGSGLDADTCDGQHLGTTADPTFGNVYTNGWFRNNDSGEGMYNQTTQQHFYSDDDDYWNIAGGSSANGLRFRDEHDGTIRGYLYANNSNEIGLLDGSGNWNIRTTQSGLTKIGSNAYQLVNGNNNRNMYYYSGGSGDIGISGYDSGGNWKFQLYGTTSYYGFLNSNWGSWDIKKNVNGEMDIRVGSTERRVLHSGNWSSYVSASQVLYIDVYGQGNAGDRNTANSWAQSAVSIPNDTLYIIRWRYQYSYWVNNHTASGDEDRRAVFYKNSSGSVYWAGVDRS